MQLTDIRLLVDELNRSITGFQFMDALNRFYSEDISTSENGSNPTEGLEHYKNAAGNFISSVTNYEAQLKDVIIGADLSACLWHYKFDHAQWGHWDKEQISIQCWKDGKIIRETHLYKS